MGTEQENLNQPESLLAQPLEYVLPNTYHIEDKEEEYSLYTLLQLTWDYIKAAPEPETDLPTDPVRLEVIKQLTDYYERLYNQCLNDNKNTQSIPREISDIAELIYTNSKFELTEYCPPLYHITKGISKIYLQYIGLIGYMRDYKEMAAHTIPDDTTNHAHYYNKYIDKVHKSYIPYLKTCIDTIAEADRLDRKGLHQLMFQMDYEVVDPHTEIKPLVALIRGVQNSRNFRNRTNTIIGLRDTISMCNTIRILWFLSVLNHNIAGIDDLVPDPDCEVGLDSENPDEILESLQCIKDYIDGAGDNFGNSSDITDSLKDLANTSTNKNKINSYLDLLEYINGLINKALGWLNGLQIQLNLDWAQKILDKLGDLAQKLRDWLNNSYFAHLINKINQVLDMINATLATIKNFMCLLKQFLCKLAGLIHFMDTVIGPLLDQFKAIWDKIKADFNDTIDFFTNTYVNPINNAIRRMVAELARSKLKTRASQLSTAMGQPLTENTTVTKIIDIVLDEFLGIDPTPLALENLKNSTKTAMQQQKDSFKSALSKSNAMNCPPVAIPTLTVPDLSLSVKLPGLNTVNPDVLC